MTEIQDEIDAEPSEVCICIIITALADEIAVSVAVMMMISEVTQICKYQLAESAVKLMKYN